MVRYAGLLTSFKVDTPIFWNHRRRRLNLTVGACIFCRMNVSAIQGLNFSDTSLLFLHFLIVLVHFH